MGYIINLKKSDLTPVQDLVYIGARFGMDLALIFLLDPRKDTLISCVLFIWQGRLLQASASVSSAPGPHGGDLVGLQHAHLRMMPIQWYLKDRLSSQHGLNHLVFINSDQVLALQWWTLNSNLSVGRPFTPLPHTVTVTMNASMPRGRNYIPSSSTGYGTWRRGCSISMFWSSRLFD